MAVEVADGGAALASGLLQLVQLLPGGAVCLRIDGTRQQIQLAGAHLMVRQQKLIPEVVDQGMGRAATAKRLASLMFDQAEEALQPVGRCGQVGIVEAVEQVRAIPTYYVDYMVDEAGGLGVEPRPRCDALQLGKVVP